MIDLYLRADNEKVMNAALEAAKLDPLIAVDVIGQITRIVDGEPVTISGWHVNLRGEFTGEQIQALAALALPAPANPFRVFA